MEFQAMNDITTNYQMNVNCGISSITFSGISKNEQYEIKHNVKE